MPFCTPLGDNKPWVTGISDICIILFFLASEAKLRLTSIKLAVLASFPRGTTCSALARGSPLTAYLRLIQRKYGINIVQPNWIYHFIKFSCLATVADLSLRIVKHFTYTCKNCPVKPTESNFLLLNIWRRNCKRRFSSVSSSSSSFFPCYLDFRYKRSKLLFFLSVTFN